MSNHDDNLSADSHELERFSSDEELQEQVVVPGEKLVARDIHHVQNVIVGTQNIYQGTPFPPAHQKPIFMAAPLPPDFVERPHEFEQLKQQLLKGPGTGITTITSTLLGAGGFGKTTLALALCHDSDIRATFSDAILWAQLSEQSGDPRRIIKELIKVVTGKQEEFDSIPVAITELRRALAPHGVPLRCLLVIDDVWSSAELSPLLQGASDCACLVTTRNNEVLSFQQRERAISVDAMSMAEAIQLLSAGIEVSNVQKQEKHLLEKLTAHLGEWPILLRLANGVLRERVRLNDTFLSALNYLQHALEKRGVIAFDIRNASMREEAVARTLEVSLLQLDAAERKRYEELAIFPEDVNIPLETVFQFWRTTGSFDELDTEELCQRLYGLSLLLSYDLKSRHIRLHDVVRNYLQLKIAAHLPALHQQFLDSYALARWVDLSPEEPYLWEHLAEHLFVADRKETLHMILTDASFLEALLRRSGVAVVQKTFEFVIEDFILRQIANAVRTGAVVLNYAPEELWNQVKGRTEIGTALHVSLLQHSPRFELCFATLLPVDETMLNVFEGHLSTVFCCAFSPDGKNAVSASKDMTLRLWSVTTGETVRVFTGHTDAVLGCAFSPDGRQALSASEDDTLRLWNVTSGETVRIFEGHRNSVHKCAFSPDGKQILSASDDQTLRLWDVASGEMVHVFQGHDDTLWDCAFSPDGRQALSASEDNTLQLWDVASGETICVFGQNGTRWKRVFGCAFSPDGKQVLSAQESELELWDVASGKQMRVFGSFFEEQGHTKEVRHCAFSPDGKQILSASWDMTLRLWNVTNGETLRVFTGHTDAVLDCAFSPDGRQALSASQDGTLRLWDLSGKITANAFDRHTDAVVSCAFSPDGRQALSASQDCTLRLWDVTTGKTVRVFTGHTDAVLDCAFSPDGRQALSASQDCTLRLWDVSTGKIVRVFEGSEYFYDSEGRYKSGFRGCAISPDGRLVLGASKDESLWLWNVSSKESPHFFTSGWFDRENRHTDSIGDCVFSPDGKLVLSASNDCTLRLWNVTMRKTVRVFKGHSGSVIRCAFSPDGKQILSASRDDTLRLWNVTNGEIVRVFEGHANDVYSCAFSSDGKQALSASKDRTLRLWDVITGHEIVRWTTDAELVSCEISSDRHTVIAGDNAGGFHFLSIIME